jgi:excisionase family DNA binding protein
MKPRLKPKRKLTKAERCELPFIDPAALDYRPRQARRLLNCGHTYLYKLLASGALQSFKDGGARKITAESIRRHREEMLLAAQAAVKALTPP